MRNYFFLIASMFFYINANAQQPISFSIHGKLYSDTATGIIFLYYPSNGKWTKDSCEVVKGLFSFSGKLIHPVFGRMVYKNKMKEIFLEPTNINVFNKEESFDQAEISGSLTQREYEELDRSIRRINSRWQSVKDTLTAVNKRSNTAFQELKNWVLVPYFEEIRQAYLDFFKQKPMSYVTAYFLSINVLEMNQGGMPTDTLERYYNHFPASVKSSLYGEKIVEELHKRKIAVPGTKAIDFTKTDVNGQTLSLSLFRGKYVLLDFWGSWCVPCRKGHPHLKELYSRYKEKGFDIIGIAADNNTEDAWHKAIEKDELPWHHILVGDLEAVYNITFYPTKILIDRQGNIIGRFGEDEKELDEQLKAIFN